MVDCWLFFFSKNLENRTSVDTRAQDEYAVHCTVHVLPGFISRSNHNRGYNNGDNRIATSGLAATATNL